MSLIPIFDWDRLTWASGAGEFFDPFDDLDASFGRWIHRPLLFPAPLLPLPWVPNKFRITVDVAGYNSDSVKTDVQGGKVVVTAKEEDKQDNNDYTLREFRRSYELPKNAETEKLTSFVTRSGLLLIDVPLKREQQDQNNNQNNNNNNNKNNNHNNNNRNYNHQQNNQNREQNNNHSQKNQSQEVNAHRTPLFAFDDMFPKISDDGKSMSLHVTLPEQIDPTKISCTVKDRELVIRAEDKTEKKDGVTSAYSFFQRRTLPSNTDVNALRCTVKDNKLTVSGPLLTAQASQGRQIPIERESRNNY
jgi:HSP20 family molecular chaperone IbpA